MECEKVDITVLVVDDDNISLSIIACILKSFQYKVLIANNGHEALETLRQYEGFVDIIITDLHMPAMNGLELQKLINKQFQIPVIVMSEDRRKCVRTKSLESGAVGFMVKPMRPDDLKNVWQYAVAARKGKGTSEGQSSIPSEVGNVGDVNSDKSSETKPKRGRKTKDNKRKASESESADSEKDMSEKNGLMPLKKPKVVWTNKLHNQFLMAIKQIGLGKAVPKRILVLMNAPGLTRENVASHLQKYRIFLRKVSQIGAMKGLSDRVLRSKFASGLINDIRKRTTQIRLPVHQQHMRSTSSSGTAAITINSSMCQAQTGQLPIPLHRRSQNLRTQLPLRVSSSLNNQVRLDNSSFGIIGSNAIQTNDHYFQQPMLGHYQNPLHQANQTYNVGASLLAYGGEGLIGCKDMNYASFGNSCFNCAPSNGNQLGYFGNINLSQNSTNNCHPNNGFQLNDGRLTMAGMNQTGVNTSVGIPDLEGNNSFGLINGSSNSIMHSNPQGATNGFGLTSFTNGTPNAILPPTPTGNNKGRMDQLGLSNVRVPPYENNTSYGFRNSASNAIMPVARSWNGRIDQAGLHSAVGEPAYVNNSFGFNNGTPNAIMPIAATTNGDSGLCQASAARVRNGSELVISNVIQEENGYGLPSLAEQLDYLPSALTNNATQEGNISELPSSSGQPDGLRNAGHENQHYYFNPLSQDQDQQYSEDDLSELFFMLDNMHHLDGEQDGELQVPNFFMFPTQTGENSDGGKFINPDFSNSCHAEQYLEQPQGESGRINVPATEGNIYVPNKLPSLSDENPNQPQGINEFVGLEEQLSGYIVDKAASASTSDTELDWDIELIEALFGADQNVSV